MGYCPLVDFHLFSLTKRFPITPSAIYICIDKTVPGFLDVTRFLPLDVTITINEQEAIQLSKYVGGGAKYSESISEAVRLLASQE